MVWPGSGHKLVIKWVSEAAGLGIVHWTVRQLQCARAGGGARLPGRTGAGLPHRHWERMGRPGQGCLLWHTWACHTSLTLILLLAATLCPVTARRNENCK